MKLKTKLTLILVGTIVLINATAQFFQYRGTVSRIRSLSDSNVSLLEEREKANAHKVFSAVEQSVKGSLERGEMQKFTRLAEAQKSVQGLLEFSLYDRDGKVSHSSSQANVGREIDAGTRQKLSGVFEPVTLVSEDAIQIYSVQAVTPDCVRCHTSWKTGESGGTLFFSFSTEAIKDTRQKALKAISETRAAALGSSILSLLVLFALLSVVVFFVVRKFVSTPLERFVGALRSDLTKLVTVYSRDEIGQIAEMFNTFLNKLNKAIGTAKVASKKVMGETSRNAQSIEETSTSLEEITSMTSMSADNAREAASLVQTAKDSMEQAAQSMSSLNQAMSDLANASRETAGIVRSIDEIAFQTNLLALNAAVEAARAGEAGAGFAVVADEVRNLAKRSTDAAKTTSNLIAETVKKIEGSTVVLNNTSQLFREAKEGNAKVASLMEEIARASSEQASGINQVSSAINDIDQSIRGSVDSVTNLDNIMSEFKTD